MSRRNLSTTTLATVLFVSIISSAQLAGATFFQTTTGEGTVGKDIGGVWLAVHHIMPMFRVRLDRGVDRVAPFDVGPIGADQAELFWGTPRGVVITKMADPSLSARLGIFEGDVISKIGTTPVVDVASYEKALSAVDKWFLVTIKRASMRNTSAKLVKIEYSAKEGQLDDGTTGIAEEKKQIQFLDVTLPFAEQLEKTRQTHTGFTPDEKTLSELSGVWWKLPLPKNPTFVGAEHRIAVEGSYDSAMREDENLNDTSFAIISKLKSNPMLGGSGQTIALYGVREVVPKKRIGGTYVETTLAQAPFPISIEFAGSFTMYRLDDFSNKDVEYRSRETTKAQRELEQADVPVAPDLPAVLPPVEANPPQVAE